MNEIIGKIMKDFNLSEQKIPAINYAKLFEEQVDTVITNQVNVCSFTFGIPDKSILKELKKNSVTLIGTATTVNEAVLLDEAGVDFIVAQGSEAGGHRGSFTNKTSESLIGSMALIPQIVDAVSRPVIAAGGMMDGRGILASLILGASGVQMGTAFLTCKESGASQLYKEKILTSSEDDLVITNVFSGKNARGIYNRFINDMEPYRERVLQFPYQNDLTSNVRKIASYLNNEEYMSLWAGQAIRLAQLNLSVEELLKKFIYEVENLINKNKFKL